MSDEMGDLPPDDETLPPDVVRAAEPSETPPPRGEVEDALRFVNRSLLEHKLSHLDVAATLKAVVETLVHAGALPPTEYERRRTKHLDAAARTLREHPPVKFGDAVDKYGLDKLPDVDCAALMPICKARCCKLTVFCSAQDLDERVVHWDYSRPYQLRKRESDRYCVHSEPETRRCGIYAQRPATCRTYDCRHDRRIWRDFERRIPAD
jgi:Fe-S-cluster containining protein